MLPTRETKRQLPAFIYDFIEQSATNVNVRPRPVPKSVVPQRSTEILCKVPKYCWRIPKFTPEKLDTFLMMLEMSMGEEFSALRYDRRMRTLRAKPWVRPLLGKPAVRFPKRIRLVIPTTWGEDGGDPSMD